MEHPPGRSLAQYSVPYDADPMLSGLSSPLPPAESLFDDADMNYLFASMGPEMRSIYNASSSGSLDLQMFPSPSSMAMDDDAFAAFAFDPFLGLDCNSNFNSGDGDGLLMPEAPVNSSQALANTIANSSVLSNGNNNPRSVNKNVKKKKSKKATVFVVGNGQQQQQLMATGPIVCGRCPEPCSDANTLQAHLANEHNCFLCTECQPLDLYNRRCYSRRCDLTKHHQREHLPMMERLQAQLSQTVPRKKKKKKTESPKIEGLKEEKKEKKEKKVKKEKKDNDEPKKKKKKEGPTIWPLNQPNCLLEKNSCSNILEQEPTSNELEKSFFPFNILGHSF